MSKKVLIEENADRRIVMHRNESEGHRRVVFEDTVFDDAILAKNDRLRKEGLMPYCHNLPAFGEGESVECIMAFRVHPDLWARFRRDEPQLVCDLESSHEPTRLKAAAKLRMMHPEWCITEKHR